MSLRQGFRDYCYQHGINPLYLKKVACVYLEKDADFEDFVDIIKDQFGNKETLIGAAVGGLGAHAMGYNPFLGAAVGGLGGSLFKGQGNFFNNKKDYTSLSQQELDDKITALDNRLKKTESIAKPSFWSSPFEYFSAPSDEEYAIMDAFGTDYDETSKRIYDSATDYSDMRKAYRFKYRADEKRLEEMKKHRKEKYGH